MLSIISTVLRIAPLPAPRDDEYREHEPFRASSLERRYGHEGGPLHAPRKVRKTIVILSGRGLSEVGG